MTASLNIKRLGTVKDVAELCGVSVEHVRRLADRGAIPKPIRLGRSVRFNLEQIESWLANGCPDLRKQRSGHR